MQLTRFTDLGLRILMRLAVAEAGQSLTTRAVAEQLAVSATHAAKVVTRLQSLGVVETKRGRQGGLVITDFGRTQSIGALTRELEGSAEVIECEGDTPCPLRDACRLRWILRDAKEAFFVALDPWTVTDLTTHPTAGVLLQLTVRPTV